MSLNFSHLGQDNPLALHMQYLAKSLCLCGILGVTDDFALSIDGGEIIIIHLRCGKKLHQSTIDTVELEGLHITLAFSEDHGVRVATATVKEQDDRRLAG